MSVSVRIPTILRTYTGGESEVTAAGATLAEVLDDLDGSYSGIKGRILDEAGEPAPLRQRVRRQRRRALPRQPRHRDARRHPDLGDPGRRRRLIRGPTSGHSTADPSGRARARPRPSAAAERAGWFGPVELSSPG